MQQTAPPLETGKITFIEHFLPPVQAGEYIVSVQQNVLNQHPTGAGDQINESYINTRRFAVRGERFSFDPGEVYAFFPPVNSQGEYANVLPHIVFSRRTLLWERSPNDSQQGYPWLAVLLFDANDPPVAVTTAQVGDLQRQPFARDPKSTSTSASTLPAATASYVDGFQSLGLEFALDYGENWYDPCNIIDVPADLFSEIAPSLADLRWLGHARMVDTTSKAGTPSETGTGVFSVLVGNRVPTPNTKCTAHVVSLEGMSAFLPTQDPNTGDYVPASFKLADGTVATAVRLVSLQSWSFTSVDPAESFDGYLTNLNIGSMQIPTQTDGGGSDDVVKNAFALGYTAINHDTRQGDSTVSWYRGPLVPFQTPDTLFVPPTDPDTNLPTQLVNTADELLRYDPTTGMMDVTYSSAWQIGRLLALQNQSFATLLYNWKRMNAKKTSMAFMREAAYNRFGQTLHLPAGFALTQPTPDDLSRLTQQAVVGFMLNMLKPHLSAIDQPEQGADEKGGS